MIQPKKNHLELFYKISEENWVPTIYSSLSYVGNTFVCPNAESEKSEENSMYSIRLIPDYLTLSLKNPKRFHIKKIKHFNWGYAIDLENVSGSEQYVKTQFGSNAKTIRRYVTRLESCFNITYTMFYGEMDQGVYKTIMNALKNMLIRRFNQRGDEHKELKRWDYLQELNYNRIINKKASLFVIFDNGKPIEISLNYHFDKILFSAISSYDIDYSKFGLGHIEIYKQIEWCLMNDIKVFEMGVGEMDYKRRWSNLIYNFEHHIIYPKKGILLVSAAKLEILKVVLKEYLKSKDINTYIYKLKSLIFKSNDGNQVGKMIDSPAYTTEILTDYESSEIAQKVDLNAPSLSFLKKTVYDYLYTNIEHVSNVEVFEIKPQKEFVIKGTKSIQKITITQKS